MSRTLSAESILILIESNWIHLETVSWFISFIWFVSFVWFFWGN